MGALIDAINTNNTLGRSNLADKGVELPETATTYDIMSAIAEIEGGGTEYTNIEYNEDNTITLTDKDGITHTMVCTYDDAGKLVEVTYEDGKVVEVFYEDESLKKIGATNIKLHGLFPIVRSEITYDTIDDLIAEGVRVSTNYGKVIKTYDGVSICGYTLNSDNKAGYYYIVSETKHGCVATNVEYKGVVNYEGKNYHYSKNKYLANINYNDASTLKCWFIGATDDFNDTTAVTRLLDHYYYKAVSE